MHMKAHVSTAGEGTLGFRSKKLTKLYVPSAGFKFLADSFLAGKCVDWDREKKAEGLNEVSE